MRHGFAARHTATPTFNLPGLYSRRCESKEKLGSGEYECVQRVLVRYPEVSQTCPSSVATAIRMLRALARRLASSES